MLKVSYEQIVNEARVGEYEAVNVNEMSQLAASESVLKANQDKEKVLFLGVDIQNDFMENGSLGVPGSHEDIKKVNSFIFNNLDKITNIAVSLDTHHTNQIFHPSWWVDNDGNHPQPLTIISAEDVETGVWKAVYYHEDSLNYVRNLEKTGQKQLCIWPYHCIEGTPGAALESQFARMIHFHSAVRQSPIKMIVKGKDPLSEMYGIIKPEFSVDDQTDYPLLNYIKQFDKVIVAGEAESHCVYESVKQIAEHYKGDVQFTSNIYVLKDGMSCIPGFEEGSNQGWSELVEKYKIKLVNSVDLTL
ncbi:hypothetical protein ACLIA0_11165 [Bacillaceae bacterium W0354]